MFQETPLILGPLSGLTLDPMDHFEGDVELQGDRRRVEGGPKLTDESQDLPVVPG